MQSSFPSPLRRFATAAASGLYFLGCLIAALWASGGEPTGVRMAFVIFAFIFFLFSFLTYFYTIANFSTADRQHEALQLQRPPPQPIWTIGYTILGFFWAGILMWLLLWRGGL